MKKVVYSLYQISPLDIGIGPSKFARFEGMITPRDPHSSYSIHNDIESLRSLDNQLAKEHPKWSQKQVQAERHFRWKHGMGQAQIDSYKAEKRGDESLHSEEAFWDVKDGDLVHPNYGSFQRVIDNAVSEEERVSLIAWRDAAIHAESGSQIISVDYHNGHAIRYADAWVKNSDGRIKQQVRTNITNGVDLNGQEALSFLSRLTKNGRELVVDNKHNVGFVVIRPDAGNGVNLTKELSAVNKTVLTATKNTAKEIKIRLQPVDRYLQQKNDGKLIQELGTKKDSIFNRLKSMFAKPDRVGDVLVRSVSREFAGLKLSDVRINLLPNRLGRERSKRTERKIGPRARNRVEVFSLMNEKKRRIGKSIARHERKLKKMEARRETQKVVQPQKESRVGKEKIKQLFLRQTERRSANKKLEKVRMFRMSEGFKKLTKKEQRVLRREEKTLRIKESNLFRSNERRKTRRKETFLFRTEKKLLQRKERRSIRKQEKKLWEIVRKLVKKGTIIEQKSSVKNVHRNESTRKLHLANKDKKVVMISKERHSTRQEKQHVIDFSIALVIWFLLHMQVSSRHRQENKHTVSVIKDAQSKELVQKEPAPWLLFAIIWHLAMIREQGMGRGITDPYYTKKTVPKQKIIQRAVLPPMGVIFALAS